MRTKYIASLGVAALVVLTFLVALPMQAESQSRIKGEIKAIDLSERTIFVSAKGKVVPIEFSDNSVLSRSGAMIPLEELSVGERVDVTYDPYTMIAMDAIARDVLIVGTITRLGGVLSSPQLTVTPSNGKQITVKITSSTKIQKEGEKAPVSALRVGDYARVYYRLINNVAISIEAWPPKSLTDEGAYDYYKGTIYSMQWSNEIEPTLLMGVLLGPKNIEFFEVGKSTVVEINGLVFTRFDLAVGDLVVVTFSKFKNSVVKVAATRQVDPVKFSGRISNIIVEGDFAPIFVLEIQLMSSRKLEVSITPSTKLSRNNQRASAGDLKIGDRVSGAYDPLSMNLIQLAAWSIGF